MRGRCVCARVGEMVGKPTYAPFVPFSVCLSVLHSHLLYGTTETRLGADFSEKLVHPPRRILERLLLARCRRVRRKYVCVHV